MARFSLGPGYLKVMKNNTDNPLTTPNSDVGKFLFNSEMQDISYLADAFIATYQSAYPSGTHYFPSGSNASNCTYCITDNTPVLNSQAEIWPITSYSGLGIAPITEARPYSALGITRTGPYTDWTQTGMHSSGFRYAGYIDGYPGNYTKLVPEYVRGSVSITGRGPIYYHLGNPSEPETQIVSMWDLPCNSAAVPWPNGTPAPGQKNVIVSPTLVKVSRPGYDVGSAVGRQLIIDSNRIPAKIVAAGEVSISSGGTATIPVKFPLTALAYMDYHVRRSTDSLTHPVFIGSGWTDTQQIGLNYRVNANSVVLYNVGDYALVVRYMICVDDASGNTSGGSKVLFEGNASGEDYVQIKRPGSSDTSPSMSDIMMDTRLSFIPILAEGWIPRSQFTEAPTNDAMGNKAKTITFANPGTLFLPFVKYMVTFADGSIRTPRTRLLKTFAVGSAWSDTQGSNGTVALITNTSVKFHLANGNPTELRFSNDVLITYDDPDEQPTGIRYYIFGIPTSL